MNFTELNTLPWNEWMQRAREGDTQATLRLCENAKPIIDQFCHVPYFICVLGTEETRSIAVLELLEFFMNYRGQTPDNEMPKLLKHVVKCKLLHNTRWKQVRHRREQKESRNGGNGREATEIAFADVDERETQQAARTPEPETAVLQAELSQMIEEAMQWLTEREQSVIRSVYFRQNSMTEVARETNSTPQAVWYLHNSALSKLRRRLKNRKEMLTDEAA